MTEPRESVSEANKDHINDGESLSSHSSSSQREALPDTQVDLEKMQTTEEPQSNLADMTQAALSTIRSRSIPRFGHPLMHTKTNQDVIVTFEGPDDPYRPMNWPLKKKVITTLLYGLTTMGATWASAAFSPAVKEVSEEFHVGTEVSLLSISVFLLGFGLGPLLWAPLSELYGRKPAVLPPYFIAAVFSFATGAAKDIQTVILTRFFAGFFGSAPVTNTGGVLGDIWSPESRGVALVGYAMAVVSGPVIGPIVAGATVQSYLRWRWTEYMTGIIIMAVLVADVIFLDETYGPVLLVYKARRLRHESGNWALHATHEEWDVSFTELARKYLVRPFQMLCTPICFLIALYASFVYGILYANLAAFPIEFEEERGWNQFVGTLPFLAFLIGVVIAAGVNIFNQKYYTSRFRANNNQAVPEARLPPMMIGSIVFSAGLFIFAWTSDRSIPWIAPNIGAVCVGLGFFTIFQAALNYLVDTFSVYAASAIAANTFLRSILAAAFPLLIPPMLHNLGINWGVSIFAFFSIALIPIPFLFFVYGKRIRAKGYWSRESVRGPIG